MRRAEYENASILHYDARRRVGKRTCAALGELGFRRIENVDNVDTLAKLMRSRQFDLAVYGNDAAAAGSLATIRQTRQYDKSSDPYTPMILMTWNAASEAVRKALNTGTDQLLLWPFSTQQIGARVEALITARKPFIETEDYLGPERRDPMAHRPYSKSIEVPNALRAKVQRRPDLAPGIEAIQAARTSLESIKIGNIANRICAVAKMLRRHAENIGFLQDLAVDELASIRKSLGVIRKALAILQQDHKQSFCDVVERLAIQLSHSAPVMDSKGLALLEQAAMALRVAIEIDVKPTNITASATAVTSSIN
ncbi:MAG: hypothetical protein HQ502_00450 [Alphaproteobacteria bacterium]|nr:hypothetical protein [Alphaproteobacteria bacterium]